jgi:hypothetical protein
MSAAALSMHDPDFSKVAMATGPARVEGAGIRWCHCLRSYPLFPAQRSHHDPSRVIAQRVGIRAGGPGAGICGPTVQADT